MVGQAKLRERSHASMLAKKPGCIYCAGQSMATTIEHMPPIQIFDKRWRPRGLEFPACKACNNGSSHYDLVASMLARSFPSGQSSEQQREALKIFSAISNNVPGLLQEMNIGKASEKLARKRHVLPEDVHLLRADGPILSRHIYGFAANSASHCFLKKRVSQFRSPAACSQCGFPIYRLGTATYRKS